MITNDWYEEKRHYDFDSNHYSKGAGHFSQVVWKQTRYVGIGVDWNANGKVVVVVRYKPAGNRDGMFQDNVSPLCRTVDQAMSDQDLSESDGDEDGDIKLGTLVHTDTDSVETKTEDGKEIKVVTKIEKYILQKDGSQYIRTIKKKQTYQSTESELSLNFDDHVKETAMTIPSWNSKCENSIHVLRKFQQAMKSAINGGRLSVGVEKLNINDNLNKLAQFWAEKLISRPDQIRPRQEIRQCRIGETITRLWSTKDEQPNAQAIVSDWLRNEKFYDRLEHTFSTLSGSYTQLVWKNTIEFGCGFAYNAESHQTLVIVYFYPPGNIQGLFEENVPNK